MSLPQFPNKFPPITRSHAISLILAAIAMEDGGLNEIIRTQGDILQYVLGNLDPAFPAETISPDTVLQVSDATQLTVDKVAEIQNLLKDMMAALLKTVPPENPTTPAVPVVPTGPTGYPGPLLSPDYKNAQVMAVWQDDFFPKTMPANASGSARGAAITAPGNGLFLLSMQTIVAGGQLLFPVIIINDIVKISLYELDSVTIPVSAGDVLECTFVVPPPLLGGQSIVIDTPTYIYDLVSYFIKTELVFIPYSR